MLRRTPFLALASFVFVAMCASATAAGLDAQALDRGSEIAYRAALKPAAETRKLNADASLTSRIRRITNRVVAAAPAADPEARAYAWAVNVIGEASPVLVLYPHGRLLVSDGFVRSTGLDDTELAAIIAYAAAHSLLGHDERRIAERLRDDAPAADPNRRALVTADAIKASLGRIVYTAEEIVAADRASAGMLARAAYDPRSAASAWRKLASGRSTIIRQSPVDDTRLAALEGEATALRPVYEKAYEQARASARAQAGAPLRLPIGGQRPAGPR